MLKIVTLPRKRWHIGLVSIDLNRGALASNFIPATDISYGHRPTTFSLNFYLIFPWSPLCSLFRLCSGFEVKQ